MKGVTKKIAAILIIVAMVAGYISIYIGKKADTTRTMDSTTFVKTALQVAIERNGKSYYPDTDDCSGFVKTVIEGNSVQGITGMGASMSTNSNGGNGRYAADWVDYQNRNLTIQYNGGNVEIRQIDYRDTTVNWYDGVGSDFTLEPGDIVASWPYDDSGNRPFNYGHCFIYVGEFDSKDAMKSSLESKYGVSIPDSLINENTRGAGARYWYVEGNATTQEVRLRNYNWSDNTNGNKRMYPRVILRITTSVQNGSYKIKLGKKSSEDYNGALIAGAVFKVNDNEITTQTSPVDAVTGSTTISNIAINNTNSDSYVFGENTAPEGFEKHNGVYRIIVRKGVVNNKYTVTEVYYDSGSDASHKEGRITSDGKYWITDQRDLKADSAASDSEKQNSIAYIEVTGGMLDIAYVGIDKPSKTNKIVRKVWNDHDNQYGTRPESIVVQLQANGADQGDPVTLNEQNSWSHTWNNLEKKLNGVDIAYTVKEVSNVKGYTVTTQESGNTTTITNTLNEEQPEVGKGTVGLYKYEDTNLNGKYDEGEPSIEGAEFKIATSEENANNNIFVKDSSGNDLIAISGKDGTAEFKDLEFDSQTLENAKYEEIDEETGTLYHKYDWSKVETTYYIKETKAPEGYREINEIISVSAKKDYYNLEDITSLVQVGNIKKIYDLALRKFITEVHDGVTGEKSKIILDVDDKEEISRAPEVDVTDLASGKSTTATYNHIKDPVLVHTTDVVTYTIQVYNEGPEDAYVAEIMDDIPEGLEFLPNNELNKEYKWVMYKEVSSSAETDKNTVIHDGKKYVKTDDAKEADIIVTDYLKMDSEEKNLMKAFDKNTMKEPDSRFVKVDFKVTEPTTSGRIVTNSAQITKETDNTGKDVTDRDSTPNEWLDEDDEDVEHLRVLYFDLALRKWVTQAIVTENGKTVVYETGHKAEDDPEDVVKVDLKKSKLEDVTVKFKYSIRVTNQGEIAGEALEVRDDIPEGLEFHQEDNPDWKLVDGKIITEKLAKTTLQPGESAEVEIILTWINGKENLGVKTNIAEINKDHNDYGTKDIDSTPGNNVPGEDDIDDAPVMLSIKTGSQVIAYVSLALGFIAIVSMGTVLVKKNFNRKFY